MSSESLSSKIDEAMKQFFVGNYDDFSEEEINELYREASDIFRRVSNQRGESVNPWEYKIIFVAVVNLTKQWKSDESGSDSGWLKYLSKKLLGSDCELQGKLYLNLTNCVKELAKQNEIFMLTSTRNKYYATICCHAFSPLSSTESLFDLCWEIYTKDLNFSYPLSPDLLTEIGNSLKAKIGKDLDDSDFTLGSKVYALRIGIKGLAVDNLQGLCSLLDEILLDIDCCYNSKAFTEQDYLSKLVRKWWYGKSATFGVSFRNKPTRRKDSSELVRDLSSLHARFLVKDDSPCLFIPRFKLSDSIVEPITVKVMNQDEVMIDQPVLIAGSGLLRITKELHFSLDRITPKAESHISVSIYSAGKKVYDSKSDLFRTFILFDKSGKEVRGGFLTPGNYFLLVDNPNDCQIPQDFQRMKGNLFSLFTKEDDFLQIGTERIYFENFQTDIKAYFSYNKVSSVCYECEDIQYTIINGDLKLVIGNEINISDLGLICGQTSYKASSFPRSDLDGKIQFNLDSLTEYGKPIIIVVFCIAQTSLYQYCIVFDFMILR